jgi:hypothetical protein
VLLAEGGVEGGGVGAVGAPFATILSLKVDFIRLIPPSGVSANVEGRDDPDELGALAADMVIPDRAS